MPTAPEARPNQVRNSRGTASETRWTSTQTPSAKVRDAAEAILLDTDGYVVEGIISNLFFCLDEKVYTPSLEFAGVEGIMRQQILKYFEDQAIHVEIGRFYCDLLLNASECFLCNSVHGIRPIHAIDDAIFTTGTISQMLMRSFNSKTATGSRAAG